MKYRCTAYPNLSFGSFSFKNGVFETEDPAQIAELKNSPFVEEFIEGLVTATVKEEAPAVEPESQLMYYRLASRITVEDAKRYADERGIPYPEDVNKEELLSAINTAQADKINA